MATKFYDFQKVRGVCIQTTSGNQGAGNEITFDVPAGSFVDVRAYVTTAFNGTTPTLTVDDGTTTFINAADITIAGAVAGGEKFYTSNGTITISIGGSGSTTGELYVEARYTNSQISDGTYSNNG